MPQRANLFRNLIPFRPHLLQHHHICIVPNHPIRQPILRAGPDAVHIPGRNPY
jgi:hypothetical protein